MPGIDPKRVECSYNELNKNEEMWDIFTIKEEYYPTKLDKHGRFYYKKGKHGIIDQPLISRYLKDRGYFADYPEGKTFAICLTHDVDDVFPTFNHMALSSLRCLTRLEFSNAYKQFAWKFQGNKKSPYLDLQEIINLECRYGAKSTFFFLAGSKDLWHRYDLKDVENEIGQLADQGWEVGLHGGYNSFNDMDVLSIEKYELEKRTGIELNGFRGHFLRFKVPDTWILLSKLGFKYDSTLGYPYNTGFRNGTCYPFEPFDIRNDKYIDILEIPMAIMDCALMWQERSYKGALKRVKLMIDAVESCNGVLVLNWHSHNLLCPFRNSWLKLYENILKYCTMKNALITNGIGIARLFGNGKNGTE